MKQDKQIKKKMYKAAPGIKLPLYYKGSIIRIGEEPVEIDIEALGYEPKIQFQKAIKDKQIIETGVE